MYFVPCVKKQGLSYAQFRCNVNLNYALDSLHFFVQGTDMIFRKQTKSKTQVGNTSMVVFYVDVFELQTPANVEKILGDFDSQAEMSVHVWKGGFVVKAL